MARFEVITRVNAFVEERWVVLAHSPGEARKRFDSQHESVAFIEETVIEDSEQDREILSVTRQGVSMK